MLIEDQYTLISAHLKAVDVLNKYLRSKASKKHGQAVIRRTKEDLLEYQRNLIAYTEASALFTIKQSELSIESSAFSTEFNMKASYQLSSISLKESVRGDLTMEVF